jgi:2-polyprenyl-6-methoxyphenol hydroxylase-like FAD-dependent oxidoreductase
MFSLSFFRVRILAAWFRVRRVLTTRLLDAISSPRPILPPGRGALVMKACLELLEENGVTLDLQRGAGEALAGDS